MNGTTIIVLIKLHPLMHSLISSEAARASVHEHRLVRPNRKLTIWIPANLCGSVCPHVDSKCGCHRSVVISLAREITTDRKRVIDTRLHSWQEIVPHSSIIQAASPSMLWWIDIGGGRLNEYLYPYYSTWQAYLWPLRLGFALGPKSMASALTPTTSKPIASLCEFYRLFH